MTHNFGVQLVGSAGQNLVNSRGVLVDDKSKASTMADKRQMHDMDYIVNILHRQALLQSKRLHQS